ncbi:unnamed protein product [Dicrocoelium dendriticum]|nr:unnamed protein product [Dicrocoelium dendriticum]
MLYCSGIVLYLAKTSRLLRELHSHCCLRTIGSYINEYRFLKSEDIFLLNRILSLIANYLESNPNLSDPGPGSDFSDTRSSGTELDNDDPMLLGNQEFIPPGSVEPCEPINALGQSDDEQVFLSGYCGSIIGDPDAEATLKLIMKLQKRETFNISSSDSEESDLDTREFLNEVRSISVSLPENTPVPIVRSTGRVYQRSQSCRYAQSTNAPRNPPLIRVFELDFHCEVDGMRGFVYGTGGALLSTIRRVVRQLNSVQRLYLTDLFLNAFDARNLILDIHKVYYIVYELPCSNFLANSLKELSSFPYCFQTSSRCLLDLNLVHLSKPSTDPQLRSPGALTNTSVTCHQDCCWYLLDSRWLEARPHQSHTNPLADLCYLFPHLRRLTLAPTQISGPMLLRLLYQTTLQELILVEVCWRLSPARSRSSHASDMFLHATFCSIVSIDID